MSDWEKEVRQLASQGKKIEAVKRYKEATGASLLEAKTAVEQMELPSKPAAALPELDKALLEEILRLLRDNRKLDAVKLYKDHLKVGLMESKTEVEAIAAHFGVELPKGKGCIGIFLIGISLGITLWMAS